MGSIERRISSWLQAGLDPRTADPRLLRNLRYSGAVVLGVLGLGAFLLLRALAAGAVPQGAIAVAAILAAMASRPSGKAQPTRLANHVPPFLLFSLIAASHFIGGPAALGLPWPALVPP